MAFSSGNFRYCLCASSLTFDLLANSIASDGGGLLQSVYRVIILPWRHVVKVLGQFIDTTVDSRIGPVVKSAF